MLEAEAVHRYYFAVDVNLENLSRVRELNDKFQYVTIIGLRAMFSQAIYVAREVASEPEAVLSIVSFGSTFTNAPEAILEARLRQWGQIASFALLGQDGPPNDNGETHATYHTEAYTRFIDRGLEESDRIMGQRVFGSSRRVYCRIGSQPYRHTFHIELENGILFSAFTSFKFTTSELEDAFGRESWVTLKTFGNQRTTMSEFALK